MLILPFVDQPTDEPFWISKDAFRAYFDQHDFNFYREAEVVHLAYRRDWFIDLNGVSKFVLPIVTFIGSKTQFINGRHRTIVLFPHLAELPIALATTHLSPSQIALREAIPKRPLYLSEPMNLPDLPFLLESAQIGAPMQTATPNPSIEGTSTIRLRLFAAAPHVKR